MEKFNDLFFFKNSELDYISYDYVNRKIAPTKEIPKSYQTSTSDNETK